MTATPDRAARRKRRVASDEAHAWARSLTLNNPLGKSLLRAICLYCNDLGTCIAGIETLAKDCDVSPDTVRSRLKFLEAIGAIVRFARWLDEHGRSNSEGRGKRTTDEIRIMIDSDPDEIEARARGENPDDGADGADGISPGQQQGLNSEHETVSPRPALGQPLDSAQGLISEPEPESSPHPPFGGRLADFENQESSEATSSAEPEHFGFFKKNYPDREMWAWPKALPIFAALTPAEQELAAAASPEYAKKIEATKRKPPPVRPERFLKDRIFDNFSNARLPEKPVDPAWIDEGPDIEALRVLATVTGSPPPRLIHDEVKGSGLMRKAPIGEDLRAISRFAGSDILDWFVAEPETREFNAWRHRIHEWTGHWAEPRMVMRRGTRMIRGALGVADFEAQIRQNGIPVPCRWPPRKDGTILPESNEGNR